MYSRPARRSTVAPTPCAYTFTVTNLGPGTLTSVTVTDPLPASVTFASASVGCTNLNGTVVCDLGTLAANTAAAAQVVVVPTQAGALTNQATASGDTANSVTVHDSASVVATVLAVGTDLTVELTTSDVVCGPDPKKATSQLCTVNGTLTFLNAGVPYLAADVTLTKSCKSPAKPGCTLALDWTLTKLALAGLPDHYIQFYLSDDAVLDAGDTGLVKKLVSTTILLKILTKPGFRMTFTLPDKKVDVAGKYLIIKVDDINPKTGTDAVPETNESNNTAVFGPLP